MKLFLIIALGIAFGIALIPAARRVVRWLAELPQSASRFRAGLPIIGLSLVGLGVLALNMWYAQPKRSASEESYPQDSPARQRYSHDSLLACSDSALLVQRDYRDSVTEQEASDLVEPSRSKGDSAWLAWKRRVDERKTPRNSFSVWLEGPQTCEDYRSERYRSP